MARLEARSWMTRLTSLPVLWLWPPLLAALPHVQHLPPGLALACLGFWGWRLALALGDRPLPPRWIRVVLGLGALAGIWLQYGTLVGQQAGVPLFVLLLFIKLLETRSLAEKRLLLILTQFMAMAYFLFGQSLPVTVYMLALAVFSIAVMAHLQGEGRLSPGPALKLSARLFAGGIPLALLLFVFFPRLDHPLWSLPTGPATAATGLSDSMAPGDIANLIQSGGIAFRVEFDGPVPDPDALYWRGLVLQDFDGRAWRGDQNPTPFAGETSTSGPLLRLSLTLEPHQQRWLFSLGPPSPLPDGTRLAAGFQWLARDKVDKRRRWDFQTYPRYRLLEPAAEIERSLRLPEDFNPRARALAQSWRQADPRPEALVQQALALFNRDFTYTLQPPLLGVNSVDDFLFGSRRGFCEHFSSSFVFLMRAADVPARVVTGYLGGEVNPLDGHMVVRQSDAHAWAEVWMGPDTGWQRVDPTASVSPARVQSGLGAALPAAEIPPALARLSLSWLQGARHTWEMLNNGWNQWVLGYGQAQQLALLARLAPDFVSVHWLGSATILAGLLGLGLLGVLYWRGLGELRPAPEVRVWRQVERRLARIGLAPVIGETPAALAIRVSRVRPDLALAIQALAESYAACRYGQDKTQCQTLLQTAQKFRPRTRPRPRPYSR
ncbi:MAG: DUF3488 and transglutaminase-like domain-containing protein [Pseudomonadota bacterium]